MKITLTVLIAFFLQTMFGQTEDQVLLDSAKLLIKAEKNLDTEALDSFNYPHVADLLEKAVELNPANAEAHYFLGYAYSRLNSKDAGGMLGMQLDLLYKTSAQFEKVIQLTPKYAGEIFILDPYSKLSSEWGSMAIRYWYEQKPDSCIWALKEGKKRGGFGDFALALNRAALDACSQNAILLSIGDYYSFPLFYLQQVEQYRTDVTVLDASLLGTKWLPSFLSRNNILAFDLPDETLDTIQYEFWTDSIITIRDFSWTVKPTYGDIALLRSDLILLSLLKANQFKRDIYFTNGFIESYRLSLADYLTRLVIVDKLTIAGDRQTTLADFKKGITPILNLAHYLNENSTDELNLFDNFRYTLFFKANEYYGMNDRKKARALMVLLDKLVDEEKYPYQQEAGKSYGDSLRERLQIKSR